MVVEVPAAAAVMVVVAVVAVVVVAVAARLDPLVEAQSFLRSFPPSPLFPSFRPWLK
jgi:hypothetical protein